MTSLYFALLVWTLFILQHSHCDTRGGEVCLNLTSSPILEPFVDQLPSMPRIRLYSYRQLVLGAYKITQKLHRDLPPTTLYAYGTSQQTAAYPGPTLIVYQGVTARVRWENHIPDKEHFLPVDRTLDWANPQYLYVPTVVHLHGQEDESSSDGNPLAWFTAVGEKGRDYVTQDYVYPNQQRATLLWYHDHTYGITRLNVAAGLVGLYIIENPSSLPQWIPRKYLLVLVQDKQFYDDGFIKYPDIGTNPAVHPQWCPDYFGDTIVVNGKVWPYVNVAPEPQRIRLLNGANSRVFIFNLNDTRLSFIKVGTDQGYLRIPVNQTQLRLAPAERVDFVIDFSKLIPGERVLLFNNAPAPFPAGNVTIQNVLLFRVVYSSRTANQSIFQVLTPTDLSKMSSLEIIEKTSGVNLSYVKWASIYNRPLIQTAALDSGNNLTGLFLQERMTFMDPTTEQVKIGTKEVWVFVNNIPVSHPMHIHLVSFFVLGQQPFNQTRFSNNSCSFGHNYPDARSCYTGPFVAADADQIGLKDTALIQPFFVTRFYLDFTPNTGNRFPFDASTFPGYVWHCHLLEHEDNEMMRPLKFSYTSAIYPNISFPRYIPESSMSPLHMAS